jgi:hypothetical protein
VPLYINLKKKEIYWLSVKGSLKMKYWQKYFNLKRIEVRGG